jgi:hypothetical protein
VAVTEALWCLANSHRAFPQTCQMPLWKIIDSLVRLLHPMLARTQSVAVEEDREEQEVATQLTEVTPETLERNALNFLAWVRQVE